MRKSMIAAASLFAFAAPAHAADFLFSFTSTPGASGVGSQAVAGTTTGRILGLPDSGFGSAAQVWIDTYSPNPLGASLLASAFPDQVQNTFNVSGGMIVGGSFYSAGGSDFSNRLFINFDSNGTFVNYASIGSGGRAAVWNAGGLPGVTFTRIKAPVPEPTTWAMMLLGFAAVGVAMGRKRLTLSAYSAA